MEFAVIETGGKQYKVQEGSAIRFEKINKSEGGKVVFDRVLFVANKDGIKIGTPYLKDVLVEGNILSEGRSDKKIVFRYHSKTRYRKKKTHRQSFTEVKISKIK